MKLLLDQNLSRNLLADLRELWPDTSHVATEGLGTASDHEIWEYARARGYTIVSKDSDFRQLAFLHGPPPKVVWVRLGNVTTSAVLQALMHQREAIESFGLRDDEALLVLPGLPAE